MAQNKIIRGTPIIQTPHTAVLELYEIYGHTLLECIIIIEKRRSKHFRSKKGLIICLQTKMSHINLQ